MRWAATPLPCEVCGAGDLPRAVLLYADHETTPPICARCLAAGMQAVTGWAVIRAVELWAAAADTSRDIRRGRRRGAL